MKFNLIHATVRPLYVCIKCGITQPGTDTIEVHSQDDLDNLKYRHPAAHGIPVGWASYGAPDYRCLKCSG